MSDLVLNSPIDGISPLYPPGTKNWDRQPYEKTRCGDRMAGKDHKEDSENTSAAYDIASRARSLMPSLIGANAELRLAHGLLCTTLSGLHAAAEEMVTLRALLVALSEGQVGLAGAGARAVYASDLATLKACFAATSYGGRNLLGNFAADAGDCGTIRVVIDANGQDRELMHYRASLLYSRLSEATVFSASTLEGFLTQGGGFSDVMQTVGKWINAVETDMNEVNQQIDKNNREIETLSAGLGSLVDADLTAEAARLKALQLQQKLNQPSSSVTNGTPSTLVALFK